MVYATGQSLYRMVQSALPPFPQAAERGEILTRLFHDSLMFVAANAALQLKGHPIFLITGYFTGIVLDRAVQEYFEKVKQIALFTLFAKLCIVSALWSYVVEGGTWTYWPYLIHAATFAIGSKIGSVLSLRYGVPENREPQREPWNENIADSLMFIGANALFFLKGHKIIFFTGLLTGIFFDQRVKENIEKIENISKRTFTVQFWFLGATWPHFVQGTTFVVGAKIGSDLALRFQRLQGGIV